MGILTRAADLVYTFRFLKLLVTPFEKTDAYELGIVDKDGKRQKDVKLNTPDKKAAYTPFHRLVYNIRRLMSKVPGGSSKVANYAAALFLIHEKYGVDIDKVLKEMNVPESDLTEERSWFVLESGQISPGMYRINTTKMLNSTCDELVRKNDQVRIGEDCYPIGQVGSIQIYEVTHINTNQPIYITAGELNR